MLPSPSSGAPQRRRPRSRASAVATLGLSLLLCATARAEWEFGAAAGAFYDDNLTRAQNAVDKRAASAVTGAVTGTYFVPLTGSDAVTFALFAGGELFERYHGLTNVVGGGSVNYRHKFGLGAAAPWLSLTALASYDDYRDDLRTSTRLDLRAEAGQRFTEQFDASVGVYYERRYDNHGEPVVPGISGKVFDLAGTGAYVRAAYAPTNALLLDVSAGVRRGDVESTSQRSLQVFLASDAIAADPVWGDPSLYAYRLQGTTWSGSLVASYALSDQAALDLAYRYDFTRGAQGLEYTTNRVSLTVVYRR